MPLFVIRKSWGALVLLTVSLPKLADDGDAEITDCVPEPCRTISVGPDCAPGTSRLAVCAPVVVGVNATATVHDWLGGIARLLHVSA